MRFASASVDSPARLRRSTRPGPASKTSQSRPVPINSPGIGAPYRQTRAGRPNRASIGSATRTSGSPAGGVRPAAVTAVSASSTIVASWSTHGGWSTGWWRSRPRHSATVPQRAVRNSSSGVGSIDRRRRRRRASSWRGGAWPPAARRRVGPAVAGPFDRHPRPHVRESRSPIGRTRPPGVGWRRATGTRRPGSRPSRRRRCARWSRRTWRSTEAPAARSARRAASGTARATPTPVVPSNVSTRSPSGSSACTSSGSYGQWTKARSSHRLRSHARRIGAGQTRRQGLRIGPPSVRSSRGQA
jgi:hypothetical protein